MSNPPKACGVCADSGLRTMRIAGFISRGFCQSCEVGRRLSLELAPPSTATCPKCLDRGKRLVTRKGSVLPKWCACSTGYKLRLAADSDPAKGPGAATR